MLEQGLQDGKERLEQLQQQLDALRRKHEQLSQENILLHSTVGWLEGAAKRRAVAPGVQRSHPLFDDEFIGSAAGRQSVRPLFDDASNALQVSSLSVRQLLEMLPLSAMTASLGDTHLHRQIMSLTPRAAAAYWNQAVRDLKMLLYVYERDPMASSHDMGVMVNELLRWSCACYVFNPSVLQDLCDVNMSTMQHHPAPAEHWQAAWESAGMTEMQLHQIHALRDFTCDKLDSLNAERQQLVDELAQLGVAANAAAAQPTAGGHPLHDTPADSTGSCSSTNSGLIERRRWEVAQQLVCVTKARQVLVQLRSQLVVMILEPAQAARIVCAVYPYMLLGGPLYQHLPSDSADDAACSVCGNGIAASKDTTSTSSSGGQNNQQLATHVQQELPAVCIHPAWCGVARLPQLQHLSQRLPGPLAYPSDCVGQHLTSRPSLEAGGRTAGSTLATAVAAAAAAACLPGLPGLQALPTSLTVMPSLTAVGLTGALLPGLLCPQAGLTIQHSLPASVGLTGQGLAVRPSLAAPSQLASLMHDAAGDIAVVGDNYS